MSAYYDEIYQSAKRRPMAFYPKGGEMKTLFYLGIAVLCVITGNRHMKYKFCRYWLDERRFKAIELKAR